MNDKSCHQTECIIHGAVGTEALICIIISKQCNRLVDRRGTSIIWSCLPGGASFTTTTVTVNHGTGYITHKQKNWLWVTHNTYYSYVDTCICRSLA